MKKTIKHKTKSRVRSKIQSKMQSTMSSTSPTMPPKLQPKIESITPIITQPEILSATKKGKLFGAMIHVIWIIVMSIAISLLIDEIFKGSKVGNIIGLLLIAVYVIFSFARKYQLEHSSKKTLEVVDIAITLLGGFFLMTISGGRADSIGFALKNASSTYGSQPPMLVFYLGVLLVIVAIIKVFIINRTRIKYNAPKI